MGGIARSTLGMTGADLANLVNQAAIQGSVKGREFVTREDIEMAEDKIRMGPQRKSLDLQEKSKELTAYHEAGHALVSLYTEGTRFIIDHPGLFFFAMSIFLSAFYYFVSNIVGTLVFCAARLEGLTQGENVHSRNCLNQLERNKRFSEFPLSNFM